VLRLLRERPIERVGHVVVPHRPREVRELRPAVVIGELGNQHRAQAL
jgi:hypothetical protein